MIYLALFLTPLLGTLWFLNLTTFLKNLKESRDTKNQKILGAVLSFFIIFLILVFSIDNL